MTLDAIDPPHLAKVKTVEPEDLVGDKIQPGHPLFGLVWINPDRVRPLPALAATPVVGAAAPNFTARTPDGKPVSLASMEKNGKVALVFLRGFPGYQCPYCTKQVHDFAEHSADFSAAHAQVLLVYPGPPADLDQHAKEFLAKQANLPANITLVTDPDYTVTNLYSLRWDAPHETAYPSTFILATDGQVRLAKVSHTHGDRTTATDVLASLRQQ